MLKYKIMKLRKVLNRRISLRVCVLVVHVDWPVEQAMKAQSGRRGIALLFR